MGADDGILLPEWRRYVFSLSLLLSPRSDRPGPAQGSTGWARAAEPTRCGALLSPLMTRFRIAARFNATSSALSEAAAAAAVSSGAVHAVPRTEPVVSAEWLHANLRDPNVKALLEVINLFGKLVVLAST
ncbi:hypothetical protein ZWY2020_052585 [Hordeum vulgare]|nr:hypothetical protein ZWY2020_052585 [Hordeum vulgare]